MEIVNETPYPIAPHVGRLEFPGHSVTVIVKGTFQLVPDGTAQPAGDQLFPTGDEHYPDDEDRVGSVRYESDFAYLKPRADLVLVGHCHVPGGRPAPACRIGFQVGPHLRRLNVFGDRRWKRTIGFPAATDPEPFTRMELRYERSFGGADVPRNPVGRGAGKVEGAGGRRVWPLPNIEDPDEPVTSPRERPAPAGLGPLARTWKDRAALVGTYKGSWQKERWPWFPKDFDFGHFNAAPSSMQVEGYLRGDETMRCENLHPDHEIYTTQLPGVRPRCFLNQRTGPDSDETSYNEVALQLDTLWVDMDAEQLVLVWRGWLPVASDDLEDVAHIHLLSESLAEEPAPPARCQELFAAALLARQWTPGVGEEGEDARGEDESTQSDAEDQGGAGSGGIADGEPAPGGDTPGGGAPGTTPPGPRDADLADQVDAGEMKREVDAQVATFLAQAGIDPGAIPPDAQAEIQSVSDRLAQRISRGDQLALDEDELARVEQDLEQKLAQAGIDLKAVPPPSPEARREQARLLGELGVANPEEAMADEDLAQFWRLMGAVLARAGLDPQNLQPAIDLAKKQIPPEMTEIVARETGAAEGGTQGEASGADGSAGGKGTAAGEPDSPGASADAASSPNADADAAEAPGSDPTAASERSGEGASAGSFDEQDLSGADFRGRDLQGRSFAGALLVGANLSQANLAGADFSDAQLAQADLSDSALSGAQLAGADLTGANLAGADLSQANLTDAVLEQADLSGATLAEAQATGALFIEANLERANLERADCTQADFSRARLGEARLRGAVLQATTLEGVLGARADFGEADVTGLRAAEAADLSEASFAGCRGTGPVWAGAHLSRADFTGARIPRAIFDRAALEGATFDRADLTASRFLRARLEGARLTQANLFESTFEKANLSGADLRGANAYGAEFLDAQTEGARFEGANVKMTKLQRG